MLSDVEPHVHRGFLANVQNDRRNRRPEARGAHGVAHGQAHFEPGSANRVVVVGVGAGERTRLQHHQRMPVPVGELQLVEYVVMQAHDREVEPVVRHGTGVLCEFGLHERQRRRRKLAVVQPDIQNAVADDRVLVRPGIVDQQLVKA